MHLEEDGFGLDSAPRAGLSLLTTQIQAARERALSPVPRFFTDIAKAIHVANPTRSLPPLSQMMQTELGIDQLPADAVGIDRLLTQIHLFVVSNGLNAPRHLSGVLREALTAANGPLVSVDLTYSRL